MAADFAPGDQEIDRNIAFTSPASRTTYTTTELLKYTRLAALSAVCYATTMSHRTQLSVQQPLLILPAMSGTAAHTSSGTWPAARCGLPCIPHAEHNDANPTVCYVCAIVDCHLPECIGQREHIGAESDRLFARHAFLNSTFATC